MKAYMKIFIWVGTFIFLFMSLAAAYQGKFDQAIYNFLWMWFMVSGYENGK